MTNRGEKTSSICHRPLVPRDVSASEGRRSRVVLAATWLLAAASGASCKSSSAPQPPPSAVCAPAVDPGPAPLRRLTRFEIGRSLVDVMGLDPALADNLPPDEESNGYDNSSSAYSVSSLHVARLLDLGEAAATAFLAQPARVRAVAACDPTTDGDGCVQSFIKALGGALWRRRDRRPDRRRLRRRRR